MKQADTTFVKDAAVLFAETLIETMKAGSDTFAFDYEGAPQKGKEKGELMTLVVFLRPATSAYPMLNAIELVRAEAEAAGAPVGPKAAHKGLAVVPKADPGKAVPGTLAAVSAMKT